MAQNSFVAKCDCKHEGQDKIYGNGNRLFNEYNVIIDNKIAHCTVCGRDFINSKAVLNKT